MSSTPVFEEFQSNMDYAAGLVGLSKAVAAQTTAAVDTSDILRAALVMSVSAMDHYVHEKVRVEMLATYDLQRPATAAYNRFEIPLSSVGRTGEERTELAEQIRQKHGYKSFQRADKVAEAVRLVSETAIWPEIARSLTGDAAEAKQRLDLIIDRRNAIAHQADLDPSAPMVRNPISGQEAEAALRYVHDVVTALESIINAGRLPSSSS